MLRLLFLIPFILLASCSQEQTKENTSQINDSKLNAIEVSSKIDNTPQQIEDKPSTFGTSEQPIIRDREVGVIPSSLSIPAIEVHAEIMNVGLLENGQMGVPSDYMEVGWFEPGTKPGDRGNAVLAGHVDSKTGPAIFFNLEKLEIGDEVVVTGEKGETLTFIVRDKKVFPKENAPVSEIFGYTSRRMLNLITCTGTFDRKQGGHIDRLVIYTELKEEKQ
ncbi:class F sortase [Bacillus sp. AK128]